VIFLKSVISLIGSHCDYYHWKPKNPATPLVSTYTVHLPTQPFIALAHYA